MNGTCKLCGNVSPLKESHIIPDFYIRGLEHNLVTGSQGISQPFSILLSANPHFEGGVKQRGQWEKIIGMKEKLLCSDCEQKFQKNETYVRDLLYGNSPLPLKKLEMGNRLHEITERFQVEDLLEVRKVKVEYKRLKLFQMSILWRAGISRGSFFKEVNLGEFHETKLQELLNAENPGLYTDYSCIMIDLRLNENGCEDGIGQPKRRLGHHQKSYLFIMGGYAFEFIVSKQKPRPGALLCCVKPSGEMIVLVASAKKFFSSWAIAFRKAG